MSYINDRGPACERCGTRPDDPVWARPAGESRHIMCLGCVADLRYLGRRVVVVARVQYSEDR